MTNCRKATSPKRGLWCVAHLDRTWTACWFKSKWRAKIHWFSHHSMFPFYYVCESRQFVAERPEWRRVGGS